MRFHFRKNQNESTLPEVNRTDNALFILRQAGQVAQKKLFPLVLSS
jgi:hypothetical protein